nr:hypothetical protein [uncultured Actinoplanes sp.]
MTTEVLGGPPVAVAEDADAGRRPADGAVRRRLADLSALVSYAALAMYVMSRLLADPDHRMIKANPDDHGLFLFFMAHGERVVFHGASPLWSDRLNVPGGVNMMVNTSMLAVSLPLAPVTHWFGPAVTVAVLFVLGLGGTAAAWYWVLSRHLVRSRAAAWIGGVWAGFAPGFISHAGGHVNFVSGYVMPFIVWQVLRLREPGRVWRGGVALGLLVTLQIFLNEELLLFAAIPLVLFVGVYSAARPRLVPEAGLRFVAGGLVAVAVAGALAAYPLWWQFAGPGHYRGQPFVIDRFATSLGSIVAYPREAIAGNDALAARLSASPNEDNAFWGAGACLMIVVSVIVFWRSVAIRAIAFAALVMLVLSFGTHFRLTATPGTVPAPLGWVGRLPVFDMVTVPRYALPATVLVGLLLALAADHVRTVRRSGRLAFRAGLVLALAPLFPLPVPTIDAPPVPAFFAERMWQPYVAGGRSVVPVPMPDLAGGGWNSTRMASLSNLAFPVPRGYFMGPKDEPDDITASWSAPRRYASGLFLDVRRTGVAPDMSDWRGRLVRQDLSFWKAGVVVLMPGVTHREALRKTLVGALGEPQRAGGVDFWDTRSLP